MELTRKIKIRIFGVNVNVGQKLGKTYINSIRKIQVFH